MAKRSMRILSSQGDTVLHEWDTDTVTKDKLKEIEDDYNKLVKEGKIPADITDKKNEIVTGKEFNPDADILFIPHIQGGSR